MNTTEEIKLYISKFKNQEPIMTDDVYNYIAAKNANVTKAVINTIMSRIAADTALRSYKNGVYYKSIETIFGYMPIDEKQYIAKRYILSEDEIFGYETGPSFMQRLGLTTQIPKYTYIVTNKVHQSRTIEDLKVCLIGSDVKITRNNYKYLQLLDMLKNKYEVTFDGVNDPYVVYREFIDKNNLQYKKLLALANREHAKKKIILEELAKLADEEYETTFR